MLYHCVVLNTVHTQILAIARLLEATVRHLGDERDVVVYPHTAEAQRSRDAQRTADVTRPHRGGQPVASGVGPRDRLLLIGERLNGDDRAEDLALDHLVVLAQAGHHRRLEEEAGTVGGLAAGDHLSVVGPAREEALDALALARGVDRAERRVRRERVA